MTRIARLEHIKKIEDALIDGMKQQEQLREEEQKAIEAELDSKQRMTKYEMESRKQDEVLANMEFQANQKLLELMRQRQSEDNVKKMKQEIDQLQKEEDHRERMLQERWRLEDQEQRLKSELIRQTINEQS